MNHVYTYHARQHCLTRKQNVFSSTFVFAVLVFYKHRELNELWSSIFFVVQKSSGHKPTKSFHQWTFFLFSSSDDPQLAQIALPPASTKQEAQAVPQHNGFLAQDCSMMRPEKWNQAIYFKRTWINIQRGKRSKVLTLYHETLKRLMVFICFVRPRMYLTLFTASKL